jgi:hypothetical protein
VAVNVIVIYESLTGNTRRAAGMIADELAVAGHPTTVSPIDDIDFQALRAADLVVVGGWVDGLVLVAQKPGRIGRLRKLPWITGKKAVVFCTYAINSGHALDKLAALVEDRGAEVIGGMKIRRDRLDEGTADFVARTLEAVQPA